MPRERFKQKYSAGLLVFELLVEFLVWLPHGWLFSQKQTCKVIF